ncbi:MAG: conjugal transfer protein TraF [Vicinamibacterales bacterium]
MNNLTVGFLVFAFSLGLLPAGAAAQSFTAAGTRAQGMGGAFVGVADDGTAIYWNPAGLAAGSYFSLVVDGGVGEAAPDGSPMGSQKSSFLIGLSTPALGLGYYRLRAASVVPPVTLLPIDGALPNRNLSLAAPVRVDSLVTHHAGITLVQSITRAIAIGTTLKLVRGIAASSAIAAATAKEALESDAAEVLGKPGNRFDLDVGLMAAGGPLKVGLTLRNLREPSFETADGTTRLTLERQARAGFSYAVTSNWVAAADFDLLRSNDGFGKRRDIALGVEGRLAPRAFVRSGVSFNTLDDPALEDARGLAYSLGGSYAARASVFIDGHVTAGGDRTGVQWGIAARFVY